MGDAEQLSWMNSFRGGTAFLGDRFRGWTGAVILNAGEAGVRDRTSAATFSAV